VMNFPSFSVYERPRMTGAALPFITNASSGKLDKNTYSPCVWRGKENPWGNFSSFICDVLFRTTNKSGELLPYKLSDVKQFDGTINSAYTECSYTSKTLMKSPWAYIVSFTTAGEDWFLIPADFNLAYSGQYFTTCASISPNNGTVAVLYLRVGADYTMTRNVNHATYELFGDIPRNALFGGRLILEEEV